MILDCRIDSIKKEKQMKIQINFRSIENRAEGYFIGKAYQPS